MHISSIFAWLEGVLKPVLDVLPQSEVEKEDVAKFGVGRNINAADKGVAAGKGSRKSGAKSKCTH